MYTDLTPETKGTNMSRYRILIEEMLQQKTQYVHEVIPFLLRECQSRLKSDNAYTSIKFDYFLRSTAPVSGITSYSDYRAEMEGRLVDGNIRLFLKLHMMYTSLCPCSKEISEYGAHNQRSLADVTVELDESNGIMWIEDLVDIINKCASAPIINALKRVDEAYQTELMYENPVFVEDMVRKVAVELDKELDKRIKDYLVVVNHEESIHQSTAVAVISAGRELH